MIGAWTKHLKEADDKAQLEREIRGSKNVLERLSQLAREDEEGIERSEIDLKSFDTPNWAEKQAWRNGFKACLHKYNKLTNLDQEDIIIS